VLAKLGKPLKIPKNIKLPKDNFARESADDMFAKGKYAAAIPLYLNLIRSPGIRTSPRAADLLFRLAFAYLKINSMLEALTIADYLADYFPEAPNTPRALLGVAQLLWNKSKKTKDPVLKEKYLQDSLTVYDSYLTNCPTDEYADEISSRVAKVYYDKAQNLALQANKMPNSPAKAKKAEEARESFRRTIPLYKRIMDNYLQTDMGKKAAYLLAWCYSNSRQYAKAAEVFLKFADAETNREEKAKVDWGLVADAKLRAAQNYVQFASSLDKEAKAFRLEADTAPKAGSPAAEKVVDGKKPATEEGLLDAAKKNDAEARKYYKLGVEHILELVGNWCSPKGRLAKAKSAKHKKKIAKARLDAYGLLPWAYDGARDNKKAIAAFTDYVRRYPKAKDKAKCMTRLGMLYIEENKPNEAAQVFKALTREFPEEGKKVLPKMARTMYEIGKYEKSIDSVRKLFSKKPIDASISDLRWIAKNLSDCGGSHPKEAAKLALQACEILSDKLKNPVWKDWVRKDTAKLMRSDSKLLKRQKGILTEQIRFMTGAAAYWAGEYKKSTAALSALLVNKNTPYLVNAHFLRADAYRKLKKPQAALDEDYNPIAFYILGAKDAPTSLYYRVQCSIGDTYLEMKQVSKAAGAYGLVDMAVQASSDDNDEPPLREKKKETPAEKKLQASWIEYALFMDVCCQKDLGKTDVVKRLAALYRKHYPAGRFKTQVDSPPSPYEAMKSSPDHKKQ
ncbi:MAG: tetratricopeptide repeat protein, partial [Kiritimatiellaeota bacterium]|nr:tetratricopeptide repeat protein [Kiritimatiellota bacterium]